MQVTGKLTVKGETQTFGAKGFRKREFVLTTDGDYPQTVLLELVQDKCDLLDQFKQGSEIVASVNINGRKWTNPEGVDKYFNSIQAWRLELAGAVAKEAEPLGVQADDLPF
mgnify:CR=1 FL=1